MNTRFKNHVLICLLLFTIKSYTQNADNTRMKRDIEVAENILSTLLTQQSNFSYGNNVEGNYIEGHGVLFTIYGNVFSNLNFNKTILLPPGLNLGEDGVYTLGKTTDKPLNLDSLSNALRTKTKEAMKTFITDYAQLLSQLKPEEKVLLRFTIGGKNGAYKIIGMPVLAATSPEPNKDKPEKTLKEFSAEITKAALDEYRTGKLSKAQLEDRIKFVEQNVTTKKDTELELLSSIFHRLYQGDLSETFRLYNDPNYERIEGLGVIFNMNFGRFFGQWGRNFTIRGAQDRLWQLEKEQKEKSSKESEEEDWEQKMTDQYPEFLEDFKQNIIEYGRTVRNLGSNELLIFKLNLLSCNDCDIPEEIELSVKKSVLEDYDKDKISLEEAANKIVEKVTPRQD